MNNLAYNMQDMTETEPENYFALALNDYLTDAGRGSETALAIESGVPQPTINRIKSGHSYGLRSNCHKIAAAMGTTYEDMLLRGKQIAAGEKLGDTAQTQTRELSEMLVTYPNLNKEIFNKLALIRSKNPEQFGRLVGQIEATADILASQKDDDKKEEPG